MPRVDFSRDILVPAEATSVWETVTDVQRVAGWVSVVGAVEEIEHLARYSAVLADRLGPFKLSADLDVEVTEIEDGRSIAFVADGEDRQVASRIRIVAALQLAPSDTGTSVVVAGMYEVTGRVASLGASMIRSKGDKILEEFFAAVVRELS
jgi:carbon monoxide dehydrogenase subunit G